MRPRHETILACDFETTVYEGQTKTEVWRSACVELGTEDVKIFHSIDEQFDYFLSLKTNLICYYHNLKFDGNFWMYYLMNVLGYQQAYETLDEESGIVQFMKDKDMPDKSFKYMISDMGMWYSLTIKVGRRYITIKDSLKLLPFTLKTIGKSFQTKHQKLDMEYVGYRYAGCEITPEEQAYIANDVLVLKEALEFMFAEGHNKLTIGSCCLQEYKNIMQRQYDYYFPELTEEDDEYIRKSYRGGWCYLVKGKESQVKYDGTTADVNSLYPSMMSSESGNKYPIGYPTYWYGNYIPEEALSEDKYYFVKIKTRFYIKENKLPFIQVKHKLIYSPNEMLESSDYIDKKTGKRYLYYINPATNEREDTRIEMTMTMTDFELFKEHYDLYEFEILGGVYFNAKVGIFDEYIEKYKKIKVESKGAMRQLAKLFLNNLYGKMASSSKSSFKVAYNKEDGNIGFYTIFDNQKKKGFIAVGSAITSYARNFTIRAAQQNFYGVNERGFIYADTDSIHCDLPPEQLVGIKVHDKNFCCWKLESCWDVGYFERQKTYIEHITVEDMEKIDTPYYNVKCAGMPDKCKNLFIDSLTGTKREDYNYNEKELEFISIKRELTDFHIGLSITGKLTPKRIEGGVLLVEGDYTMR